MSRLFFDSHDSFLASRSDHSLGSLPDVEIFDLLEEFYAAEDLLVQNLIFLKKMHLCSVRRKHVFAT